MRTSICIVRIDGKDVSSAILPRLQSLTVTDKAGASSDTVSVELDDADGVILLPRDGVSIEVELGYMGEGSAVVFRGVVDEVRSSGSRNSGRTLSVSGKGFDTRGKAKEPRTKHWDDKSLADVLQDAARLAGLGAVRIDAALGPIIRPYWAMQGESFVHFAERLAREVGATFKVSRDVVVFAKRNGGASPAGKDLPTIRAAYGDNLLSWDIAPVLGRARYAKARTRWYDPKTAEWQVEEVEIADAEATAEYTSRFPVADAGEAGKTSGSRKADSERARGGGSISIDGNPDPQPEGTVVLVGARPGIDGVYRIDSVTHEYSRGSGWTTRLDLKQPQGGAGTDKRKSGRIPVPKPKPKT